MSSRAFTVLIASIAVLALAGTAWAQSPTQDQYGPGSPPGAPPSSPPGAPPDGDVAPFGGAGEGQLSGSGGGPIQAAEGDADLGASLSGGEALPFTGLDLLLLVLIALALLAAGLLLASAERARRGRLARRHAAG